MCSELVWRVDVGHWDRRLEEWMRDRPGGVVLSGEPERYEMSFYFSGQDGRNNVEGLQKMWNDVLVERAGEKV
jgi:hypothetical protein